MQGGDGPGELPVGGSDGRSPRPSLRGASRLRFAPRARICRPPRRPATGLLAATHRRPFPLSAGDRVLRPRPVPLVRQAGARDAGDRRGIDVAMARGRRWFRPLCRLRSCATGQSMGRAQSLRALERLVLRQERHPQRAEPQPLPAHRGGARYAAVARHPGQGSDRDVLDAGPPHPHPRAYRHQQCPDHGPLAAGRSRGLRLSGRFPDARVARRRGLGLRRHDRARSVERQRPAARDPDRRCLEPAPDRGGARGGAAIG